MSPKLVLQHPSSWPYNVGMRRVWCVCALFGCAVVCVCVYVCVVGMEGHSHNQKHHVL